MEQIETKNAPQFTALSPHELAPHPLNRKRFNEGQQKELQASIEAEGVLTPLLVRPVDDGYQIIAGERRWRAVKAIGLTEIPCVVRKLDDFKALELLVVENLQREDVHPLEEAAGYFELLKQPGMDTDLLAVKVGKSKSYIYQRLQLNLLVDKAAKAFLSDKIGLSHALQIARLTSKDQVDALGFCGRGDIGVTGGQLRSWVARTIHLELKSAPFKAEDAELFPKAGPCTTCPKRTGSNPSLFPEIRDKDTCTDRGCYGKKVAAFLNAQRAKLKAGGRFYEVSTEHWWYGNKGKKPGKLLMAGEYATVRKSDPKAVPALVVDGKTVGKVLYVTKGKPKPADDAFSMRQRAEERKRRAARRLEIRIRGTLFDRIDREIDQVNLDDLRMAAKAMFSRLWSGHQKALCGRLGLEPVKTAKHSQWEAAGHRYIDGLVARSALDSFLVRMALSADLTVGTYDDGRPERLEEMADRHKIDHAAVRKELVAAAKKKEAKKPTAVKKATKKKRPTKRRAGDVRRARSKKRATKKG